MLLLSPVINHVFFAIIANYCYYYPPLLPTLVIPYYLPIFSVHLHSETLGPHAEEEAVAAHAGAGATPAVSRWEAQLTSNQGSNQGSLKDCRVFHQQITHDQVISEW